MSKKCRIGIAGHMKLNCWLKENWESIIKYEWKMVDIASRASRDLEIRITGAMVTYNVRNDPDLEWPKKKKKEVSSLSVGKEIDKLEEKIKVVDKNVAHRYEALLEQINDLDKALVRAIARLDDRLRKIEVVVKVADVEDLDWATVPDLINRINELEGRIHSKSVTQGQDSTGQNKRPHCSDGSPMPVQFKMDKDEVVCG